MSKATSDIWIWLAALVAIEAAIVGSLLVVRQRTLAALDRPQAREAWLAWKAETERMSREQGPVRRRAVRVDEPPGLILIRDHFGGVLIGVLAVSTAFFGFLLLIVRGMLFSRQGRTAIGDSSHAMRRGSEI